MVCRGEQIDLKRTSRQGRPYSASPFREPILLALHRGPRCRQLARRSRGINPIPSRHHKALRTLVILKVDEAMTALQQYAIHPTNPMQDAMVKGGVMIQTFLNNFINLPSRYSAVPLTPGQVISRQATRFRVAYNRKLTGLSLQLLPSYRLLLSRTKTPTTTCLPSITNGLPFQEKVASVPRFATD